MPKEDYLVTIGLEVHCQLRTASKMFCGCAVRYGDEPNTLTCPVCLGLPGALPVLNAGAIEGTILAGMCLGCETPPLVKWDRKSYFYPDMPKNYQTTQFDLPLCLGGGVPLYESAYPKDWQKKIVRPKHTIGLTRIHLEEDVGKSTHHGTYSTLDFNRAGTPLMELVSEPEIESAEEAVAYITSLRQILVYAGLSDADMEKGQMRCDVNISLRPPGQQEFGAKIELKNLNSLSAVRRAIHHEIERQSEELDLGIPQIQSTRRWDDERGETAVMRTKEDAHDYRYLPCPDLLPLHTADLITAARKRIPELPHEKWARLVSGYQLSETTAEQLCSDRRISDYFEEGASYLMSSLNFRAISRLANIVVNEMAAILASKHFDFPRYLEHAKAEDQRFNFGQFYNLPPESQLPIYPVFEFDPAIYAFEEELNEPDPAPITIFSIPPSGMAYLSKEIEQGSLSGAMMKRDILPGMLFSGFHAGQIVKTKGLEQVSDTGFLDEIITQVLAANADAVEKIKAGNDKAINALKGQVMKLSQGKANPKVVGDLLEARLKR